MTLEPPPTNEQPITDAYPMFNALGIEEIHLKRLRKTWYASCGTATHKFETTGVTIVDALVALHTMLCEFSMEAKTYGSAQS